MHIVYTYNSYPLVHLLYPTLYDCTWNHTLLTWTSIWQISWWPSAAAAWRGVCLFWPSIKKLGSFPSTAMYRVVRCYTPSKMSTQRTAPTQEGITAPIPCMLKKNISWVIIVILFYWPRRWMTLWSSPCFAEIYSCLVGYFTFLGFKLRTI